VLITSSCVYLYTFRIRWLCSDVASTNPIRLCTIRVSEYIQLGVGFYSSSKQGSFFWQRQYYRIYAIAENSLIVEYTESTSLVNHCVTFIWKSQSLVSSSFLLSTPLRGLKGIRDTIWPIENTLHNIYEQHLYFY
jgi:hypothetical protein